LSQILKEIPEWAKNLDPPGRPCKYNWDSWFDGQQHLLVRSTPEHPEGDYDTETRFFRHTVLRAAERWGVEVDVVWKSGRNFEDGRDRMIVQAKAKSKVQTYHQKHDITPKITIDTMMNVPLEELHRGTYGKDVWKENYVS